MPKVDKKIKKIAIAVSAVIAICIVVFGSVTVGFTAALDDFVFFGLVAARSPVAILSYIDYRWRKAVDERLPDLFRSIVQAQETGMTLPQALEGAAKRDYGSLTKEVRKMTTQISWGMTFENALLAFGQRVRTALVQRSVPMIIEANRSGGHIERVLDPMG